MTCACHTCMGNPSASCPPKLHLVQQSYINAVEGTGTMSLTVLTVGMDARGKGFVNHTYSYPCLFCWMTCRHTPAVRTLLAGLHI